MKMNFIENNEKNISPQSYADYNKQMFEYTLSHNSSNEIISYYHRESIYHQENNDAFLDQIAESHIFNRNLQEGNGLLRGKMGMAIFFFLYARYKNSEIYEDFAGKLINDICEDIHSATPIDLRDGLCGIGWGVEYLVQHHYIEGDTDDILENIDRKIMETDLRRLTDFSMESGLEGILWYALIRLNSPYSKQAFDNTYKKDLYKICKNKKMYVATLLHQVLNGEHIGEYPFWKVLSLIISQHKDELLWKKGIDILL